MLNFLHKLRFYKTVALRLTYLNKTRAAAKERKQKYLPPSHEGFGCLNLSTPTGKIANIVDAF